MISQGDVEKLTLQLISRQDYILFHTNLKEIPASVTVMESNIRRVGGDGRFFLFGVFSRELYETGSLSNTFDGRQIDLIPSRNALTHKSHGRHDC